MFPEYNKITMTKFENLLSRTTEPIPPKLINNQAFNSQKGDNNFLFSKFYGIIIALLRVN